MFDAEPPTDFVDLFLEDEVASTSPTDKFLLEMSDLALKLLTSDLRDQAKIIMGAVLTPRSNDEVHGILERIRQVAPAEGCKHMANIINAAWRANNDADLWKDFNNVKERKPEVLKDLILKNLEIYEIERTLSE